MWWAQTGSHKGQYISNREMGVGIGRATTRAHPPHPLPARPYYTANRPAKPAYSRGRGGCGRGDGALVAARPCPPHLFSLFEKVLSDRKGSLYLSPRQDATFQPSNPH